MESKQRSFYSDGQSALESAVRGFVALRPGLHLHENQKVIYRNSHSGHSDKSRVTVLSGGGSGHEPCHAGFVGSGMLDAVVCGAVFASPNAMQIQTGLGLIQSPRGTLIVVKNYTGDKLNFTLASERFQIQSKLPNQLVVVADDVSIGRSKSARVGRRGLAGTVLVHKLAGGASADGKSLSEIVELSNFATQHMGTMGVALDGCDVPGKPLRASNEGLELGIGIHNEPGSRILSPKPSPSSLIKTMLGYILDTEDKERNYLAHSPLDGSCEVIVLVNNLGGLSALELSAFVGETQLQLRATYSINPARVYAGTFLSALNGPGFSITILALPRGNDLTQKVIQYLDGPTDAPGWTPNISTSTWNASKPAVPSADSAESSGREISAPHIPCDAKLFQNIINSVHKSLVKEEPEITRLDTMMGDGDCGTTLLAGIDAVMKGADEKTIDLSSLVRGLMSVAETLSLSMGGTSGALYAVFFTAFASSLTSVQGDTQADFPSLVRAASAALNSLQGVTAAKKGDRTMMDALIPFIETLVANVQVGKVGALHRSNVAAEAGCKATSNIKSHFGRSTYVSTEGSEDATSGLMDPGACGVIAIVQGLIDAVIKGSAEEIIP